MNTGTLGKNIKGDFVLTRRELEHLLLVALGYKNYEIAGILIVTISTVKKSLEKIFRKLNAKDRANAVAIAFLHKIIYPDLFKKMNEKYNLKKHNEYIMNSIELI